MKTAIVAIAFLCSTPAWAADECVRVGEMYYSAAFQRDQAIPQDAVTNNIRKNFASLSNHYNIELVVSAAFKHYDVSPEMLQGLASSKCQDDRR